MRPEGDSSSTAARLGQGEGLVLRFYRWRACPEANARTGAGYGCKSTVNILKFRRGEISDCFLVQSKLVQLLHAKYLLVQVAHAGASNFMVNREKGRSERQKFPFAEQAL